MSQSRNPTDSQALLQSMLQRLKLQPGREGQAYLHPPVPNTPAPTWGQDGERGASNLQNVNNSRVNGFGSHGVPSNESGISAADSNFALKGVEIQQSGPGGEVDRGLISSPTQKDNTDGDMGENRVVGQSTQPGITPTGTEQLFPAKSLKDADITSFERSDGERVSFGSSAVTTHKNAVTSVGQNQYQNQSFTPKSYVWSMKTSEANLDTGSQENKVFHVGNGGFGASAQSKDMQIVPANSSFRRKQRSSENKTRRWTQKIKERWRDRPGSFGKKEKEEQREEQKSEQGNKISPQNQPSTAESLINAANKEEERTLPSPDGSDLGKTSLTHTDDGTSEGYTRSAGDFEFGLGSFSLLDEIVTGQEWAKFLNPNLSAASAIQRPSEEPKIPPNPYNSSQTSVIMNHQGGVDKQWSFRGTEASPVTNFSRAQISPDAFQPVSMDVSEGRQQQDVHRGADQSEPMEHGHTQSGVRSGDNGPGQQLTPPSFTRPADILNSSALKSRGHLNRKRQHQSAERRDERPQTGIISDAKEANKEGSRSPLSLTSSPLMETTGGSQHDSVMPLYTLKSPPPPLSPSSFSPFSHVPKGVLKHSISQDSLSSMEVVTKRRRVEENRRVHFSEEVMTIEPPEMDEVATDSEEDSASAADEDSLIDQELESERAVMEDLAPARRPVLPAWIRALKRKNTGRKPR
ncbi:uncharacterized protein [Pagrus major]|uniref:uncharacterized protein n=1 Tax=Pagrus major TaxID=143350 RepID=UPI003CC86D1B